MRTALVASVAESARLAIAEAGGAGYKVEWLACADGCMNLFRQLKPDLLFIDVEYLKALAGDSGSCKSVLQSLWRIFPPTEIVVMASAEKIREAIMALKVGAVDYLTHPVDSEEVRHVMDDLHESLIVHGELDYLRDQFWQAEALEFFSTRSPQMQYALRLVKSVAPTPSTVHLILYVLSG